MTRIDQEKNVNRMAPDPVNIDSARENVFNLEKEAWNENVINVSKLKTYVRYKKRIYGRITCTQCFQSST